jgi:predicted nuclease of predicted toxin-antitoxin system
VKLKLDENIAASAGRRLPALGLDVDTVVSEGLAGKTDREGWVAAPLAGRLLVTQDFDFSDARTFAPGTHAGLLIVRLPDTEPWRLSDDLAGWFAGPDVASWEGCFVVATPRKIGVLRP